MKHLLLSEKEELQMEPEAEELLKLAMRELSPTEANFSAIKKVATRIAKMEKSDIIKTYHLAEAIQYRGDFEDYVKYYIDQEWASFSDARRVEREKSSAILGRLEEVFGKGAKYRLIDLIEEMSRMDTTKLSVSKVQVWLAQLKKKYAIPLPEEHIQKEKDIEQIKKLMKKWDIGEIKLERHLK